METGSALGRVRSSANRTRLVQWLFGLFGWQQLSPFLQPLANGVDVQRYAREIKVARDFGYLVTALLRRIVSIPDHGHADYKLQQAVTLPRAEVLARRRHSS